MNKENFKKCPEHYAHGMETVEKSRMILGHLDGKVSAFEAGVIFSFIKYIDRLGMKDSIEKDSFKAADFIHLAVKGNFLNKVLTQEEKNSYEWKTVADFNSPHIRTEQK